jgi:hypothetical protein
MKLKKAAAAIGVIPLAIGLATLNSAPPSPSKKAKPEEPPCVSKLSDCPFEGCNGDPELNKLKNRTDKPAASQVEEWKLSDIVDLNDKSPRGWSKKNSRAPLQELHEGTPIVIKGWLIHAMLTGAAETCNCKLEGRDNNDYHLNLVARQNDSQKALMKESIVVELSPRSRLEGWTLPKIKALVNDDPTLTSYVRVTGWLMFDSQHASFEHMPRASAWEVHPVTKFEVCTLTKVKCDQGTGWKLLEAP